MALSKIGTDGIDTAATPTVASATVTGDLTVDTNTLYVDSTNNRVGIGVTPERQFHIEGNGAEFSLVDTQRTSGSRTANMFIDASDRTNLRMMNDAMTAAQVAIRFDASGRVTMPAQPYFLAEGANGGNGTLNSGLVPFNVAVHNVGNHFNTSTAKFTAPVDGCYLFTSAVLNYPNSSGGGETWFSVNGSGYGGFLSRYNGIPSQVSITNAATIKLAANDTVEVRATLDYYIHAGHGHFSGMLLG